MRRNRVNAAASRRLRGRGFTLIEILVVLFIITVVVTLVLGVSRTVIQMGARKQTEATQDLVMTATQEYRDRTGDWPEASNTIELMEALNEHADSRKIIADLPPRSWKGPGEPLLDGFDREMQYQATGGLGCRPALISKGADEQDEDDDIRSDDRL